MFLTSVALTDKKEQQLTVLQLPSPKETNLVTVGKEELKRGRITDLKIAGGLKTQPLLNGNVAAGCFA